MALRFPSVNIHRRSSLSRLCVSWTGETHAHSEQTGESYSDSGIFFGNFRDRSTSEEEAIQILSSLLVESRREYLNLVEELECGCQTIIRRSCLLAKDCSMCRGGWNLESYL
jgi:hypothetical protein